MNSVRILQPSSTLADLGNVSSATTATVTTGLSSGSGTDGGTGLFTRLGVPSPSGGEDNGGKLDAYQSYSPHHQQQHQPHLHHAQQQSGYMTVTAGPGTSDTPPLSSASIPPATSVEAITTTSSQTHMVQQV